MFLVDCDYGDIGGRGQGPERQEVLPQACVTGLELLLAPFRAGGYVLVDAKPRVTEAVLGIPLLNEPLVAVLGVVSGERQVRQSVEPWLPVFRIPGETTVCSSKLSAVMSSFH